jgi:hypothetical protein
MCWVESCRRVLSLRSSRSDSGVGELESLREEVEKSYPALTARATGCSVPAGLISRQCPKPFEPINKLGQSLLRVALRS